ncbi:MAG: hypothetical protein ACFE9S_13305 [Candidatus Hermodarchaeota archaeon]
MVITISEKLQKNYIRDRKEELNLVKKRLPNHEFASKKQPIANLKLVKEIKPEIDLIQKQRDKRRWRNSLGYYYLNPEKFKFGLRDLYHQHYTLT